MLHYSIYILGNSVHLVQPLWPRLWPKCLLHCHEHDPGICIRHYCFASCGKLSILYFTGSCSGADCLGEGERRAQHSAEILGCKISGVALPLPSLGWKMTPPYMFLFLQCNCVHQPYVMMHLLHPV